MGNEIVSELNLHNWTDCLGVFSSPAFDYHSLSLKCRNPLLQKPHWDTNLAKYASLLCVWQHQSCCFLPPSPQLSRRAFGSSDHQMQCLPTWKNNWIYFSVHNQNMRTHTDTSWQLQTLWKLVEKKNNSLQFLVVHLQSPVKQEQPELFLLVETHLVKWINQMEHSLIHLRNSVFPLLLSLGIFFSSRFSTSFPSWANTRLPLPPPSVIVLALWW